MNLENNSRIIGAYSLEIGLKVINSHLMHIMLNTQHFKYTRNIKDRLSPSQWNNLNENNIEKLKNNKQGITDFIIEMFEFISKKNIKVSTFTKLYKEVDVKHYKMT